MPPVPADFFGPGSDPFDGIIACQSNPPPLPEVIGCGGYLGSADTVWERTDTATLDGPGSSDIVDVELVALSLVSTEPISVTFGGGMTESFFDVYVTLHSTEPSPGTMTITKTHENGGTFDVEIDVYPRFLFIKVQGVDGADEVELEDFTTYQNSFIAVDVPWQYDAAGLACPDCAANFVPGCSDDEIAPFRLDGDHYDQWLEASCVSESHVLPGCDLYRTIEDVVISFGGAEGEFLSLPADFFEPGSDPFDGIIAFEGSPLLGDYGHADTVVQRKEAAELPESDTVEIELIELSLVSTAPIVVTGMGPPSEWDVEVTLNSTKPSLGSMQITKTLENGGMFSAEIDAWLTLLFTQVLGGGEAALDLTFSVELRAEDVPWEYDIPLWFDCPDCGSNFAPGSSDGEILPFTWESDYYDQTVEFECPNEPGIKFSVHDEPLGTLATIGMPGTDVNVNATTRLPSLEADIYEGAYGTNWIVILKEKLGLLTNDDIDALSIIDAGTPPGLDIVIDPGYFINTYWHFSVDPSSVGVPGGASPDVFSQAAKTEAAGDVFFTLFPLPAWPPPPPPGPNMLAIDDWWVGLDDTTAPAPEDDMDALDLFEDPDLLDTEFLPLQAVAFSLTPDSPSLATGPPGLFTPGTVLTSDGAGGFMVRLTDGFLGIPGDDLDALFIGAEGFPIFSVAPGSVNGLDAADLLVPAGVVGPGPIAGVLIPAAALGLAAGGDNLNALDILVGVEPFIVDDTDGDGIPDYWEDENELDPGNPDDGDDDDDEDGLDNEDEFGNGTDPNEEDSDGDGMGDGFEVDNGFDPNDDDEMGDDGASGPDGTPDGENDWDGDGYSNSQEESGGTDPRDAESIPVPVAGVVTLVVLALAVCVIALRGRRKETA